MLDRGLQALWLGGHPRRDRMGAGVSEAVGDGLRVDPVLGGHGGEGES